jgi:hypothetical protein
VEAREMALDHAPEGDRVAGNMAPGEILERVADPAYRVQHAHRALHDVGQPAPAHGIEFGGRKPIHVALPVLEVEQHGAADDGKRRLDGARDRFNERRLA